MKIDISVNMKGCWMEYKNVQLIESLGDYSKYVDRINNLFAVSESEIKHIKTFLGHGHSWLTGYSGMFCGMIDVKEKREPMLLQLKSLHGKVLCNQIKYILDGHKLVINNTGIGYFPLKKGQEYKVLRSAKKRLYTVEDIKINKWYGGIHYYAKIDGIDVVAENGNVKWNTAKAAKHEARKYLNILNQ